MVKDFVFLDFVAPVTEPHVHAEVIVLEPSATFQTFSDSANEHTPEECSQVHVLYISELDPGCKNSGYKMIRFDVVVRKKEGEHNENWPYVPDHPHRIFIVGGSVSGKTNALMNTLGHQRDIDKIFLYVRDPTEEKYDYLLRNGKVLGESTQKTQRHLLSGPRISRISTRT